MNCIACGREVKTELTAGTIECNHCGTKLLVCNGQVKGMNAMSEKEAPKLSYTEILEKISELYKSIRDLKQEKKDFNSGINDQIKDLEAQLSDYLALKEQAKES